MSRGGCEEWGGHTDDGSGELDVEELEKRRGMDSRVYEAGVVEGRARHCGGEEKGGMTGLRRECYKGDTGEPKGRIGR